METLVSKFSYNYCNGICISEDFGSKPQYIYYSINFDEYLLMWSMQDSEYESSEY